MKVFEWNERFSVGNPVLDEEHKKLFGMFDSIFQNPDAAVNSEFLSEQLTNLREYAGYHFANEEKYMLEIGYPEQTVHKEQHRRYLWKISKFCVDTMNYSDTVVKEMVEFLYGWLVNHVLNADQKYMLFNEARNSSLKQ